MPPVRRQKLTTGLILMLRHRAVNYALALKADRNDIATNECRNLLADMVVDSDVVMELTDAWLRIQNKELEPPKAPKGKRAARKEQVANGR